MCMCVFAVKVKAHELRTKGRDDLVRQLDELKTGAYARIAQIHAIRFILCAASRTYASFLCAQSSSSSVWPRLPAARLPSSRKCECCPCGFCRDVLVPSCVHPVSGSGVETTWDAACLHAYHRYPGESWGVGGWGALRGIGAAQGIEACRLDRKLPGDSQSHSQRAGGCVRSRGWLTEVGGV